jgi:hypothetical protein
MPSDHSNDNSTELNCSLDERGNSAAAGAKKALAELDQRYPFVPKVAKPRAVALRFIPAEGPRRRALRLL